ncbi:MAG TPA: hypothetical protein PKM26_07935, partial [Syntrophorhabdaceae bacterium]|nr:hypothetical protein [Syntrophorhabdaceae bacterium]
PGKEKADVDDKLYRQMFSPVQWERSIKKMGDEGIEVVLEVGPQKVLSNLVKRVVPGIACANVEKFDEIESVKGLIA